MLASQLSHSKPIAGGILCANIVSIDDDGRILLDNGTLATIATSCLVVPVPGDFVLSYQQEDVVFVLNVLSRSPDESAAILSIPNARTLSLVQDEVELKATNRLDLLSNGDINVRAANEICFHVKEWFSTVLKNRIDQAGLHVSTVENLITKVSSLMHLRGQQVLIDGEEDIRVDAKRISMG